MATNQGAYEDLVDDLLESSHFGERWALPWLDLARYADSEGYERDPLRPHAWRWRHWLIDAINRDMPYDRFTVEQIAGDLLPGATVEQRVATGFLRNGIKNREAGTKNDQKRFEETVDRLNTVTNTWLGLTVGCAQCHDHKYDPLSQREFYAMFAFFHNAVERDLEAPLPGELGPYLRTDPGYRLGVVQARAKHGIPALQATWRERMLEAMDRPGLRTDWDHSVTEWRAANDRADWLMRAPEERLTELEREKIADWFLFRSGPDFDKDEAVKERLVKAREEVTALKKGLFNVSHAYTMVERREPVPARLALRGDYRALGSEVEPGVPAVLPALPSAPAVQAVARGMDRLGAQSPDCARRGEPDLAGAFRARLGRDRRELRHPGRCAVSSRTAGLAGRRVRAPGLEPQGTCPADRDLGDLPPILPGPRGRPGARSRQRLAGPPEPREAAGGADPRQHPRVKRAVESGRGRQERLPAAAKWNFGAELLEEGLERGHGARPVSTGAVCVPSGAPRPIRCW